MIILYVSVRKLSILLDSWKITEITHHGHGEGVDFPDINEAVLPGDETLNIDVQLTPD